MYFFSFFICRCACVLSTVNRNNRFFQKFRLIRSTTLIDRMTLWTLLLAKRLRSPFSPPVTVTGHGAVKSQQIPVPAYKGADVVFESHLGPSGVRGNRRQSLRFIKQSRLPSSSRYLLQRSKVQVLDLNPIGSHSPRSVSGIDGLSLHFLRGFSVLFNPTEDGGAPQ